MRLSTKIIAIYASKKTGHYCQNYDQDHKLLLDGIDQYIV